MTFVAFFRATLAALILATSAVSWAQLRTGALAYSKGDLPAAISALRPLAEKGDAVAQRLLGNALANAKPPLLDLEEAEGWIQKSAAQGNLAAMRDLANLNFFVRRPADRVQAEKWFLAAADRGDAEAQHLLAVLLLDAKGADRRAAEAYKWLLLASERGHLLSSVMLGEISVTNSEKHEGQRLAAAWKPVR
jgi:hypothetical protein